MAKRPTQTSSLGNGSSAVAVARRIVRAELSLTVGDPVACAREARLILSDDVNHVGALEVLAKALWQTCEFAELLPVLDRLTVLNPYEPGYHSLRGAVYQALGRYGDAVRAMVRGQDASSEEGLNELQAWQANLVADMLKEDRVFRAHYAQDPEQACLARGFAFAGPVSNDAWLSEKRPAATLFTRPS